MLADWFFKKDLSICSLQETYFRAKHTHRLKIRGLEKVLHAKITKRAEAAILTSDKTDFNSRKVTRDRESYYILIKGSIQQEDIAIINIHAPGKPLKYMKQKLMEWKKQFHNKTWRFQYLCTSENNETEDKATEDFTQ